LFDIFAVSRGSSTTSYHLVFVKLDFTALTEIFFEVEISVWAMLNYSRCATPLDQSS